MTSSSDTFPFGIADVVELLGLTVRRRLPSSLYLNCPFCGDQRGRLNVNTDKNVWRCNRCGAAGGMLALYARYNCTAMPMPTARFVKRWGDTHPGQG